MIKAQVLAGGRGKGKFDNGFQGGVQTVDRYAPASRDFPAHNSSGSKSTASPGVCWQDDWFETHYEANRRSW